MKRVIYIFDEYKGKIKLIVSGSSAFYIDQSLKILWQGENDCLN